jgi:hypothetical protein
MTSTQEYIQFLAVELSKSVDLNLGQPPIYENRLGLSNELKGTYIHRRLLNRFACWCSNQYSYKIEILLDNMFSSQIHTLQEDNVKLQDHISQTSVPKENCDKKLTIYRTANDQYQVSYDQKRRFNNTIVTYEFPSALNIRDLIRKRFGNFKQLSNIDELRTYIETLNPKRTSEKIT